MFASLALFSIAGGQWATLQTVAWAKMLRDYSQQTGSVAIAVERTFDGAHPCELCRQIDSAKAKERQGTPKAPGAKDDLKVKATVAPNDLLSPAPVMMFIARMRDVPAAGASRAEQPPTPPPRHGSIAT